MQPNEILRTRSGALVRIERIDSPRRIGGVHFPVLGAVVEGASDVPGEGFTRLERTRKAYWRADGGFTLPNARPDPRDLIVPASADLTQQPGVFPLRVMEQDDMSMMGTTPSQGASYGNANSAAAGKRQPLFPVAMLTVVQANIINQARSAAPGKKDAGAEERKQIKREVFSVVKSKFGIPADHPVRASTVGADGEGYLILHTGKKNRAGEGLAYRLGADGKWDGSFLRHEQLFPVQPAASGYGSNVPAGSVFGQQPAAPEVRHQWFRLDAKEVAGALLAGVKDNVLGFEDLDYSYVDAHGEGQDEPPTPHLMLAGSNNELCIAADGSIWRYQ